ncbi:MAG: 7-carboxy-7-deazaguanine synthase QueE [Alphaproteobacteria bacterium]
MSDSDAMIRISEIFGPTIQGEGALIGRPTVFVRTGGCDYRCSWCDTMYAVDSKFRNEWQPMSAARILNEVEKLSFGKAIMITLSGGNPAIQPLKALIELGHERGHEFCMETQGSVVPDWLGALDVLTLSPKPPSSGMETDFDKLDACLALAEQGGGDTLLKIVVFDENDYIYARKIGARYPDLPLFLQPGNHAVDTDFDQDGVMERMRWLIDRAQQDLWFDITILPQLHTLIWGNKRGV